MATVLTINTDDEAGNYAGIHRWVRRECVEIQRRLKDDCFVLSGLNYDPFKSAKDPYEFRKWESSLKHVVRHPLAPAEITPLGSSRPTFKITPSPVVPDACDARTREMDCVPPTCRWYGVFHGCKAGVFCGFATKMACEHHEGCVFSRNRCREKIISAT